MGKGSLQRGYFGPKLLALRLERVHIGMAPVEVGDNLVEAGAQGGEGGLRLSAILLGRRTCLVRFIARSSGQTHKQGAGGLSRKKES